MRKAYLQPSVDIQFVASSTVLCASAGTSPTPIFTPIGTIGDDLGSETVVGD